MSAFTAPPVGQHAHVIDPPDRRAGFTRAHCARCGWSLEFLLRAQSGCEIVRPGPSLRWTSWRELRGCEVARG